MQRCTTAVARPEVLEPAWSAFILSEFCEFYHKAGHTDRSETHGFSGDII
jgi:hypothetical protein